MQGSETLLYLVLVGAIWGCTNPLIKRGSELSAAKSIGSEKKANKNVLGRFLSFWGGLLSNWQAWLGHFLSSSIGVNLLEHSKSEYVVPFAVNLSGSVLFFLTLGNADLSIAVPVANATTFAFTAVVGWMLGEEHGLTYMVAGLVLVITGLSLCVTA